MTAAALIPAKTLSNCDFSLKRFVVGIWRVSSTNTATFTWGKKKREPRLSATQICHDFLLFGPENHLTFKGTRYTLRVMEQLLKGTM